ncbi:MAG: hypothetical protein ACLPHI_08430 [Terriglobales bacterium]
MFHPKTLTHVSHWIKYSPWKDRPLPIAFWSLNIGLALIEYGTWNARSAEFMQTTLLNRLQWMRVIATGNIRVGGFDLHLRMKEIGRRNNAKAQTWKQ